ncbi:MAG: VOC family protein [Pseudomonadota bacterium]
MNAMPNGFNSLTPSFTFKDSAQAIAFYQKAFNAEIHDFLPRPGGQGVMHASLKIGNSMLMLGDEMPGNNDCGKSAETIGASPISLFLYVSNVDAAFAQALAAGAIATMPVSDMFWGDRAGMLKDPFGYSWMIATHQEDLTPEQIKTRAAAFFAQAAQNNK